MIILAVCFAMLVIGLVFFFGDHWDWREPVGLILSLLGGTGLLLCLMTIPLQRMEINAYIQKVEAARLTRAVDSGIPLEGAAWRIFVATTNAELASFRYYNNTAFDLWYPDAIEKLEPLT